MVEKLRKHELWLLTWTVVETIFGILVVVAVISDASQHRFFFFASAMLALLTMTRTEYHRGWLRCYRENGVKPVKKHNARE